MRTSAIQSVTRVLALALFTLPTALQAQSSAASEAEAVREAVVAFHEALASGDSAGALALLSDDAVILEGGRRESKDEYRAHHLPADMAFASAVPRTRSPIDVEVRGDAAWALSTAEARGRFRDRDINSASAELMVLVRTPAGWRIAAIHWSSRRN